MSLPAEGQAMYVDLLTELLDTDNHREIIQSIRENDLVNAERLCLLRMNQSEDDAVIWSLLGLVYFLKVDVKSAGEAIQRASELAPESSLTLNLMGDFLCCNGKHELGEAALQQSLDREPEQEFPLRMLLHQYAQRRDFDRMAKVLFPLVNLCPDDELVWQDLRGCVSRMKSSDEYLLEFRNLTNKFPDQYLAWHMLATCLLVKERVHDAEVAVKKALALHGNDDQTWNLYGSILNVVGRYKAAVKCHRKAVLLNRKNPDALLSLSIALIKCGKKAEAKKAIDKLIAINPQRATRILEYMIEKG